jgi:hypothetical protein
MAGSSAGQTVAARLGLRQEKSRITRFQTDQRAMASAPCADSLATRAAVSSDARNRKQHRGRSRANHANSLCYTVAVAACAILLLIGDLAAAKHYAEVLLDQAARHALARSRRGTRQYMLWEIESAGHVIIVSKMRRILRVIVQWISTHLWQSLDN